MCCDLCGHYFRCEEVEHQQAMCCGRCEEVGDCRSEPSPGLLMIDDEEELDDYDDEDEIDEDYDDEDEDDEDYDDEDEDDEDYDEDYGDDEDYDEDYDDDEDYDEDEEE